MKLSHAMSPLVAVSRLHGNTDTYMFVNGCLFCYKLWCAVCYHQSM